ncbi:MAG: hypothetical protein V4760_13635 [Bdellovibrionota bacterium]
MIATSPFSLLFAAQLMNYGLNPFEWRFDSWVCMREKSFMLKHTEDPEFKLKGCLEQAKDSMGWQLESLSVASL